MGRMTRLYFYAKSSQGWRRQKAEVARMTAAGTGMGRQVRSTLLERDDPMSPAGLCIAT